VTGVSPSVSRGNCSVVVMGLLCRVAKLVANVADLDLARWVRLVQVWRLIPATIAVAIAAATSQSTAIQNGGHQWVLATKW
jgi:hypothetical protein